MALYWAEYKPFLTDWHPLTNQTLLRKDTPQALLKHSPSTRQAVSSEYTGKHTPFQVIGQIDPRLIVWPLKQGLEVVLTVAHKVIDLTGFGHHVLHASTPCSSVQLIVFLFLNRLLIN